MNENYKVRDLKSSLLKKKNIYNKVDLSKLPDKGAKLKCQIDEIEADLKSLVLPADVERAANSNSDEKKNENTPGTSETGTTTNLSVEEKRKPTQEIFPKVKEIDPISFGDLSKISSLNEAKTETIPDSPAFKTYRSEPRSTQLIEAKPLLETASSKYHGHNPKLKVLYSLDTEETVKKLHKSLKTYPEHGEDVEEPDFLQSNLMVHQIKALSWLIWRETEHPCGGIFADDMGLGKTLTMISLILKQKESNNFFTTVKETKTQATKGTLVICLASIVHQWEFEIDRHCKPDALKVMIYHGTKRNKNVKEMQQMDVVITTYQTALAERKALMEKNQQSPLFALHWERIVLDEAHTIKNHTSKTAEAIYTLKSFRKWCVTGTPIHNELKDLYSLVKFLQFFPFDDYSKWKKLTDDNTSLSTERRNLLMKSILLRRTKNDKDVSGKPLIQMVKKHQSLEWIELADEEFKIYKDLDTKVQTLVQKCFLKPKLNTSSSLLVYLLRLQQCCSHISLLGGDVEDSILDSSSLESLELDLSKLQIDSCKTQSNESNLELSFSTIQKNKLMDRTAKSTKVNNLLSKLRVVSKNSSNTDKCVIVSQWVKMLEIIALHLDESKIPYYMIAGSTKPEDRQKMSHDFNTNDKSHKVMLLSLKAGGVGLNLIGANHLFLLDLHWNPALELQACDRIHRVGQTKEVFIHKFVCKNTIEEKILSLQDEKRDFALGVWHGAKKAAKGLSLDDFRMLFNV